MFGKTITWNGNDKLDMWGSPYCNMINGSDGKITVIKKTEDFFTIVVILYLIFCR